MSTAPKLHIDVAIEEAGWLESLGDFGAEALAKRAALAAWEKTHARAGTGDAEVSLVLLNDERQRALNRDYRGHDKPTNVLSFAANDSPQTPQPEGAPRLLGDITIALETTTQEAAEQGKALSSHFSHLVVHGMVHLAGFDHEDETGALEMESLEREILESIGVADPYSSLSLSE